MTQLLRGWSVARVMLQAPDDVAKIGQRLADVQRWQLLAHDQYSAWGTYQGSASQPYRVMVDLLKMEKGQVHVACSCADRKSPCKHAIALLYLLVESADAFDEAPTPDDVQAWLDKAAHRARKQEARKEIKKQRDSDAQISPLLAVPPIDEQTRQQRQRAFEDRKARIAAGLDDLEQWLINMVRHGLGDEQLKRYTYWDDKAARMVDAQAGGIANWLREMGGIPARQRNWVEPLLDQLGRLFLLIQSFKRFDALSPATQADIRTVLGWHLKRDEVLTAEGAMTRMVHDRWLVIGHHETTMTDKLRTQRLWLRGETSQRHALLQEFALGDERFEYIFRLGDWLDATLLYYPSRYPLRALILQGAEAAPDLQPDASMHDLNAAYQPVTQSLMANIEAYSLAIAANPWLGTFPFFMDAVIPVRVSNRQTNPSQRWLIRDESGHYLPLHPEFKHHWPLLSVSGGHPIQLAGEWDGEVFLPTAAIKYGRFVDFNRITEL